MKTKFKITATTMTVIPLSELYDREDEQPYSANGVDTMFITHILNQYIDDMKHLP